MRNSLRNRLNSYLRQRVSASMKPHLYPCLCYSYFHRREQTEGGSQQLPLPHGTVFLSYLCAGRPS